MRGLRIAAWVLFGLAWLVLVPAALACSDGGWSDEQAAHEATVIVEATVTAVVPSGGYDLAVLEIFKGEGIGSTLRIGTIPLPHFDNECSPARIRFEP
jgi:hypothetical protein